MHAGAILTELRAKLVYVLNRNAEGKLFPSSPLEAHKNHTLVTDLIAVDNVGVNGEPQRDQADPVPGI